MGFKIRKVGFLSTDDCDCYVMDDEKKIMLHFGPRREDTLFIERFYSSKSQHVPFAHPGSLLIT